MQGGFLYLLVILKYSCSGCLQGVFSSGCHDARANDKCMSPAQCRRFGARDDEVGGELVAESTGGQISSRLLSMRSANALLELPQVRAHCIHFITRHLLSHHLVLPPPYSTFVRSC